MQVEIFANVAQYKVHFSIAIDVGNGYRLPPTKHIVKVGFHLFEMTPVERKNPGRHPFTNNDQLFLRITRDIGPYRSANHSNVSDVRITGFSHIRKMALTIIYKKKTFRGHTIQLGIAS